MLPKMYIHCMMTAVTFSWHGDTEPTVSCVVITNHFRVTYQHLQRRPSQWRRQWRRWHRQRLVEALARTQVPNTQHTTPNSHASPQCCRGNDLWITTCQYAEDMSENVPADRVLACGQCNGCEEMAHFFRSTRQAFALVFSLQLTERITWLIA